VKPKTQNCDVGRICRKKTSLHRLLGYYRR